MIEYAYMNIYLFPKQKSS